MGLVGREKRRARQWGPVSQKQRNQEGRINSMWMRKMSLWAAYRSIKMI